MNQVVDILAVFGTRPEIIKLSPVLRALKNEQGLRVICVFSGQQADLAPDFLDEFGIEIGESLDVMVAGQSLNGLLSRLIESLDQVIQRRCPAAVIVQGDTTTALAGALSARYRAVPVIHVEAGLRSGNVNSPFPEETNRVLISHVSSLHLAPTEGNVAALRNEGIPACSIVLSGNPIVDALQAPRNARSPSPPLGRLFGELEEMKIVVLTTHRRENFGRRLNGYLRVIKDFIATRSDCALVFPVHPNPIVQRCAQMILGDAERVHLLEPLSYDDFYHLLGHATLVLSDSGGIQEEVITLGKPLLILRGTTERPEAVASGCARMAPTPEELAAALGNVFDDDSWCTKVKAGRNPFGDGLSGPRIAREIHAFLIEHTDQPSSDRL